MTDFSHSFARSALPAGAVMAHDAGPRLPGRRLQQGGVRSRRPTNRTKTGLAALPLAVLLVTGCMSSGTGMMIATLNTGEAYQGRFFQITHETTVDKLGPLWVGWDGRARWHAWGVWGPGEAFATEYTGKVVANLDGPRGHMRCSFNLMRPSAGIAGGGAGRCQLPDGAVFHAQFPPTS